MDLQQLTDERDIRRLVDTYCDGVNRKDGATWESVWADEGASWVLRGPEIEGKAAIRGVWDNGVAGFKRLFQAAHNGVLEIDGDTATGRWYIEERGQFVDGRVHEMVAAYHDRYVRTDAGWRIQRRELQILPMSD